MSHERACGRHSSCVSHLYQISLHFMQVCDVLGYHKFIRLSLDIILGNKQQRRKWIHGLGDNDGVPLAATQETRGWWIMGEFVPSRIGPSIEECYACSSSSGSTSPCLSPDTTDAMSVAFPVGSALYNSLISPMLTLSCGKLYMSDVRYDDTLWMHLVKWRDLTYPLRLGVAISAELDASYIESTR
ncbi:uncharacterized protein BT62DRAFT_1013535 [Guyanagaster necrorhizus]|uniref:Uncharacterized protein n=1 Tax=Guyanagaster necrorhizus TaxID=856835 RepID=A0A9P8ALF1_9AGAR|nr:uncharacterized protein BT62DRAFT_1013535 [Guyanagaster necrorhizus MCA 3950]KAG7439730.1 hypothetical protein BT62DRAFT_1013535 [Guyanagaster necrorhizus MCA 3950]